MEIAKMIDHTLLKQDASTEAIIKLCKEAKEYHFASVCVNPGFVPLAAKELKGTVSELHWVWCNGKGSHLELRQEPKGSSPFQTQVSVYFSGQTSDEKTSVI